MEFKEILLKLESLGGRAINIELRNGVRGRGLFSINPSLPIDIYIPEQLLISPGCIYIDAEGQIKIDTECSLNSEVVSFFENYHRFFGWGAGGFNAIHQHQKEIQSLPAKIKNFLFIFGWHEDLIKKPTNQYCLEKYLISRKIRIGSESKLMPIAELINHSSDGLPYILENGIKFSGVFEDELLAVYHSNLDAFHFFINYHFSSSTNSVLSCDVTVRIPNIGSLHVSRLDQLAEAKGNSRIPKAIKNATGINISFVELVNKKYPSLPRKIFTDLMVVFCVSSFVANEVFDGLISHNRQVLIDFMSECDKSSKMMARVLKTVAAYQLATLV